MRHHALEYLEKRYTVACRCGWTSAGHHFRESAQEAFREHKAEHAGAQPKKQTATR